VFTERFLTMVRTCKCGVKYRVDYEEAGFGVAMQLFQHYAEDEGFLVGLWLGVYEERRKQISVANPLTVFELASTGSFCGEDSLRFLSA
jgi:hypothetical protein